jgi:uncharacterized membrane protein YphA (DoxX/SURF4 family)
VTPLHDDPFGASWWLAAVVGAAFVWAGMGKVLDLDSWRRGSAALGAPRAATVVVPWWEIALGAALVSGWLAVPARLAALATLAAFSALLVANLARGSRPPCACFGGRTERPLSWVALVRNAALAAALVVALLLS